MSTTSHNSVKIHPSWSQHLRNEFAKPYMTELGQFLRTQTQLGRRIAPQRSEMFNALNLTPLNKVRVCIIEKEPHHREGYANGLAFSVKRGIEVPPTLANIFKELRDDVGIEAPAHGDLTHWARQGVLLLNTHFSVEMNEPGSHEDAGWKVFTDKIIETVNRECDNVVFILLGSQAQSKGRWIDQERHRVIKSTHPSPMSAHRGFFGSKPFSQANAYLKEHGHAPIDWSLNRPEPELDTELQR